MPPTVAKSLIYLTRAGDELLLMLHPDHPEAGLQVPAGTVKAGETPLLCAARELQEETGLSAFRMGACLGEQLFDMRPFGKDELHQRSFFHAELIGDCAERWRHQETDIDGPPIALEFFWWKLRSGAPNLIAGHGDMLHRLHRQHV